ncbi:hypothetical protein LCGC14_0702950 [marine sediment metagenome]|uniref:Uncharacterized protein n=1 Tax=marine sediment metagenome TaxID=412755 RepID=A0A0F9QHA7_9ZZZZ
MAAVADVISVTVNIVPNIHRFGTGGQSERVNGVQDWNIQFTQKAQGDVAPVPAVGASGTIVASEQGGNGVKYTGAGRCASVTVNLDQDTGLPIEYVYDIQANGALTPGTEGTPVGAVASSKNATIDWT